jgi:hypothetical protein
MGQEITPQEKDNVIQYIQQLLREEKQRNMGLVEAVDNLLVKLQQKDMEIVELKKQIIDKGICS